MQFTGHILLLKVADKTFTNNNGEAIVYHKVTFIMETGDVVSMTTTKEVYDTFGKVSKLDGVGTFEVTPDFKGNPKLKLLSFVED